MKRKFFYLSALFFIFLYGCKTTEKKTEIINGQSITETTVTVEVIEEKEPSFSSISDTSEPGANCKLELGLPKELAHIKNASVLHQKGKEAILAKNPQKALQLLESAKKLDDKNGFITGDLSTALLQCGMYSQAVLTAEQAAALLPQNPDIAFNLAQSYQIAGRLRTSLAAYEKAAELAPEDSEVFNNMAVVSMALGDSKQAEEQIRKAIELSPLQVEYLISLSYILVRQKRIPDAQIIIKRALEHDPENPDVYNMRGFIYATDGRQSSAIESFKKALQINPDHTGAKENLRALTENTEFELP